MGCVALLALIAGTVAYLHMHALVALHGQPGWVAALTPLSVDGMIVAASTTLLSDSRSGNRGGVLPWLLLAFGSVASLAANVAVAEPTATGRVIAAWPSFALIGWYELLMRQVPRTAPGDVRSAPKTVPRPARKGSTAADISSAVSAQRREAGQDVRMHAWQWALANRTADGSLPSGKAIRGPVRPARAVGPDGQELWCSGPVCICGSPGLTPAGGRCGVQDTPMPPVMLARRSRRAKVAPASLRNLTDGRRSLRFGSRATSISSRVFTA